MTKIFLSDSDTDFELSDWDLHDAESPEAERAMQEFMAQENAIFEMQSVLDDYHDTKSSTWKTRDGRVLWPEQFTDDHLVNAILFFETSHNTTLYKGPAPEDFKIFNDLVYEAAKRRLSY